MKTCKCFFLSFILCSFVHAQAITGSSINTGPISIPASGSPTGAAGGDLSGTYPNPTVQSVHLPATTNLATAGVFKNNLPFLSDFGSIAGENTWLGVNGNISGMTAANMTANTIIGGADSEFGPGAPFSSFTGALANDTIVGAGNLGAITHGAFAANTIYGGDNLNIYTGTDCNYNWLYGTNILSAATTGTLTQNFIVSDSFGTNFTSGNLANCIFIGDGGTGTGGSLTGGSSLLGLVTGCMPNLTTGIGDIAIGGLSGSYSGVCNYNINLGYDSGQSATGTFSSTVAIGPFSGDYATTSNEFFLNNQDRTNYAGDQTKSLLYGTFASTAAAQQLTVNGAFNIASGNVVTTTIGKTLSIKSGTNGKSGSFTLSSGNATVSNTSVTANSVIHVTLKTNSGTRAGNPDIVPTATTGFSASGAATDNSTYNFWIEENN